MIDWSKGVVARYYATMVDSSTWRDQSEFDILSGSINYSDSGIRGSADIQCRDFDHDNEYWIRIYVSAMQGGESELVPLFTGLASSPDITYNGQIPNSKVQCYSVLSPADKIYLPLGWYAQAGSNGATLIKDLLMDVTPAPIIIDGSSSAITSNIVAENDETNLSMVDKILDAINWRLIIDGDGTVHITPLADGYSATFDYMESDVIELNVTVTNNWSEIPNVFRAVGAGIASIAKDEDPDSPFSIENRGREIWAQETNCTLSEDEKISDYASRKLKEAQRVSKTVDYTRRFMPDVHITDYVWLNYPAQGITGPFVVKSQTLNLGYGGQVSEQVIGY